MLQLANIFDFPAITSVGGNMGTLDDRTSIARFSRKEPWVPLRLLVKFSNGSGTADLTMHLDHDPHSTLHSLVLKVWAAQGTGATPAHVIWVPTADETQAYVIKPPGEVVFTWANPAGGQTWELLLTAADVSAGF